MFKNWKQYGAVAVLTLSLSFVIAVGFIGTVMLCVAYWPLAVVTLGAYLFILSCVWRQWHFIRGNIS